MLVKMTCSQCGAGLEMGDDQSFMICPFCGSKVANLSQRVEIKQDVKVSHTVDKYPNASAVIRYNSSKADSTMLYRIDRGGKCGIRPGQERELVLTPGVHTAHIKIGSRNYHRDFIVPNYHAVVIIECDWFAHAEINIIQPQVQADSKGDSAPAAAPVDAVTAPKKKKGLLIWGIIVAALGFIALISSDSNTITLSILILLVGLGLLAGYILPKLLKKDKTPKEG